MPEPGLDGLDRHSTGDQERHMGVAEVVKPGSRVETRRCDGRLPGSRPKTGPGQRAAGRPGEHQTVVPDAELLQVRPERTHHGPRKAHHAAARVRLGAAEGEVAGDLLQRLHDFQAPPQQVEPVHLEARELAPAAARVRGREHQRPVASRSRLHQSCDLDGSQIRPLRLDPLGQGDAPAWRRRDQAVIDCGPHDRGEQVIDAADGLRG